MRISSDQSLLDDVRRKLVTRHVKHLTAERRDDTRPVVILSVFQHKLYHIVLRKDIDPLIKIIAAFRQGDIPRIDPA